MSVTVSKSSVLHSVCICVRIHTHTRMHTYMYTYINLRDGYFEYVPPTEDLFLQWSVLQLLTNIALFCLFKVYSSMQKKEKVLLLFWGPLGSSQHFYIIVQWKKLQIRCFLKLIGQRPEIECLNISSNSWLKNRSVVKQVMQKRAECNGRKLHHTSGDFAVKCGLWIPVPCSRAVLDVVWFQASSTLDYWATSLQSDKRKFKQWLTGEKKISICIKSLSITFYLNGLSVA